MARLRVLWVMWGERILRVLTVGASLASLVGLLPAFLPPPGSLPGWAIVLIISAVVFFGIFVVFELFGRHGHKLYAKSDTNGINAYMHHWIDHGGRVAIWSRDLSWAEEPSARSLLTNKARRNELILCVPTLNDIAAELLAAGAEVCAYGSERLESPASRFTIAFFGRAGSRVAVGRAEGDLHVIDEFSADEHPAFHLAGDLIALARSLYRDRSL